MSLVQVKRLKRPIQPRTIEATAISHIKRHNVTISHNRIAIYYFRSIAIERQSERPPKISTSFQFSGSAIEIENIRIHKTVQTQHQDIDWNEWSKKTGQSTAAAQCINTLTHRVLQPDLMKSNGKKNVPSLASQNIQAKNKQTKPSKYWDTLYPSLSFIDTGRPSGAHNPDSAPNYAARAIDIVLATLVIDH